MKFPADVVIKKIDGQESYQTYALDTTGTLWTWGRKYAYDDYYNEEENVDDFVPGYKDNFTPCKLPWFEKNGYRILDFCAGSNHAVLKASDSTGN